MLLPPNLFEKIESVRKSPSRRLIIASLDAALLFVMIGNDAPVWAIALAVLVATRASEISTMFASADVQSTWRARLSEIEKSVDTLSDRVERVLHPNVTRKVNGAQKAD